MTSGPEELDRRFKVLVVEDDAQIVRVLRLELEHEGYVVDTASDGLAGLEKALKEPDLVILDVMLPKMDGHEVCTRVRARLRERHPKSNVLSVRDLTMDRDRHEVHRGGRAIALTAKEYALLEYLLLHRNKVHTRDELFNGVWGSDFLGDSNLIDVYIRYLRGKIDDGFEDKLISTVRGVGYTLRE